jgi:1,4-alpha-glucan branching enzyme
VSVGSFVFMLHSHLPYYRKAGMWPFGEESVYECMAETYIPLLNAIGDLWDEGIAAKLTIGITPILAEQLCDPHLNAGFDKFLQDRLTAAQKDEKRFSARSETHNPDYLHLARFYVNWFLQVRRDYHERWNRDLIGAFKKYQDLGAIEITTSAATHGFSPLLKTDSSLYAQYKTGVDSYKRMFGKQPKGFWLPECAYRPAQGDRPGLEKWLYELGLEYFFTESFVIEGGQTVEMRRAFGAYGNIEYIPAKPRPATGLDTYEAYWLKEYPVAVMGRHDKAGYQVWSADQGYPGDGNYREFHKKDDVSGLHFWKLTSKSTDLGAKEIYNPEQAQKRMLENAEHYVGFLQQSLTEQLKKTGKPGLVMVSFDTELFGHWWFEGVNWIKEVIRKLRTYTAVEMVTASEYLAADPPTQAIEIPESSWGSGGHWQVWLNNDTEWMWPIINESELAMQDIAQANQGKTDPLLQRALKQAGRELLLLESSDWPFLVTTGQAKDYAVERFNDHVDRFRALIEMIRFNRLDEGKLKEFEDLDNPFPDITASSFLIPSTEVQSSSARS